MKLAKVEIKIGIFKVYMASALLAFIEMAGMAYCLGRFETWQEIFIFKLILISNFMVASKGIECRKEKVRKDTDIVESAEAL